MRKYVAQGRAEGRIEAAARVVLLVLQARGVTVPDAVRERILAQKDRGQLGRWLQKAAVASSLAEVMDESEERPSACSGVDAEIPYDVLT